MRIIITIKRWICKTSDTQYSFSHARWLTVQPVLEQQSQNLQILQILWNLLISSNSQISQSSPNSWKSFCPPASLRLCTEHDFYGMEYLHCPPWASCLAVLPPSSCTPAPQPNVGNWKKVLDFLVTTKTTSVLSTLFSY